MKKMVLLLALFFFAFACYGFFRDKTQPFTKASRTRNG